jgi:hypothetical protein
MPDATDRWEGAGRVRDVQAVEERFRHLWLAGQLDALETRLDQHVALIDDRLKAIQASQSKNLWAMVGVLISITTLSITLLLQGALGT